METYPDLLIQCSRELWDWSIGLDFGLLSSQIDRPPISILPQHRYLFWNITKDNLKERCNEAGEVARREHSLLIDLIMYRKRTDIEEKSLTRKID